MSQPMFARITLIGLGLIGSSIAWAAKRGGLAGEIVGHARSAATRAKAAELGFCDWICETAAEAAEGADLAILCVPVGAYGAVMAEIGPGLKPGAIVSDVGSVKGAVIAAVTEHLPGGVHFVPAHPIAGTEHSGPESGFAELFDGRWCILTPVPDGDPQALARLHTFWQSLGANIEEMDPAHHDLVLAVTSHVPHAIAYTMVGVAEHLRRVTDKEVIQFSAAGFRDFTRIAASDPVMWRDVFLNNREATLDILGRFTETRAIRRGIIEAGQDTPAPDFGRRAPSRPRTGGGQKDGGTA